jgi:glycosyltransferase involved in cell wall biosynthesis
VHHGGCRRSSSRSARGRRVPAFLGRIRSRSGPTARSARAPPRAAAAHRRQGRRGGPRYFATVIRPLLDGDLIEFIGEIAQEEKADFLGCALALLFPIDWPEPFGPR